MSEISSILITSSRDASTRMRQFLNELEMTIPNAIKVNRGRMSLLGLVTKAAALGIRRILYVGSRGGNPSFLRFIVINVEDGTIDVLPYVIKIHGIKLLIDLPVKVIINTKPKTAIIASLKDDSELIDILSEQLGIPAIMTDDVESIRGMYDVIITVRKNKREHEIEFLNGRDMGPRGPIMRVSDVIYAKPRVVRIE